MRADDQRGRNAVIVGSVTSKVNTRAIVRQIRNPNALGIQPACQSRNIKSLKQSARWQSKPERKPDRRALAYRERFGASQELNDVFAANDKRLTHHTLINQTQPGLGRKVCYRHHRAFRQTIGAAKERFDLNA